MSIRNVRPVPPMHYASTELDAATRQQHHADRALEATRALHAKIGALRTLFGPGLAEELEVLRENMSEHFGEALHHAGQRIERLDVDHRRSVAAADRQTELARALYFVLREAVLAYEARPMKREPTWVGSARAALTHYDDEPPF